MKNLLPFAPWSRTSPDRKTLIATIAPTSGESSASVAAYAAGPPDDQASAKTREWSTLVSQKELKEAAA